MSLLARFTRNASGRDFAVGDIHGHFTRLQAALDAVGFDPAVDRLFSVGDLVDRGPESDHVLDWLEKPWFFAVQGNHECMLVSADESLHFANGGAWYYGLPKDQRLDLLFHLSKLPYLIEVDTQAGKVGLVHADAPRTDWDDLCLAVTAGGTEAVHLTAMCQWSRRRIQNEDRSVVAGVRAVVVGHTPLRKPVVLGNVYHIDTGGWLHDNSGFFTLIDLNTLETIPPMPKKLDWEAE